MVPKILGSCPYEAFWDGDNKPYLFKTNKEYYSLDFLEYK